MSHSHEALRALATDYVLGALTAEDHAAFEAHVESCSECAAEVRSLLRTFEAVARSVPQRPPPPELRQRVMSAVERAGPVKRDPVRPSTPAASTTSVVRRSWLPVAASVLIALGAGIYGSHLHVETRLAALSDRAEATEREIAAARRAAADARAAVQVIAAPDVRQIDLQGQGSAHAATARVLWSASHGMVFAGTGVPAPPPDRRYQLWITTGTRTISGGILPDLSSGALAVLAVPSDSTGPVTVTVTLEPNEGSTAPTGPPVLVSISPRG